VAAAKWDDRQIRAIRCPPGGYWYRRQRQAPAAQARDPAYQDQLMDRLAALTGVALL